MRVLANVFAKGCTQCISEGFQPLLEVLDYQTASPLPDGVLCAIKFSASAEINLQNMWHFKMSIR